LMVLVVVVVLLLLFFCQRGSARARFCSGI
jgi:hypothetical protein